MASSEGFVRIKSGNQKIDGSNDVIAPHSERENTGEERQVGRLNAEIRLNAAYQFVVAILRAMDATLNDAPTQTCLNQTSVNPFLSR